LFSLEVYNLILRRSPVPDYEAYRGGGNCFPTTLAALASAVAKIARVTKLPPGLELYRGLGGLMDLPEGFWKADENGCRGYTEYGFMSTTSNKATALEYSGAKEKRPKPMVTPLPLVPPGQHSERPQPGTRMSKEPQAPCAGLHKRVVSMFYNMFAQNGIGIDSAKMFSPCAEV